MTEHGGRLDEHVTDDELADATVGLLSPDRTLELRAHVAGCASCAARASALAEVERLLATVPAPPMPPEVVARLEAVLTGEQRRRTSTAAPLPQHPKPTLGAFAGGAAERPGTRHVFRTVLLAAVVAMVVGFAGYVVSASAGMNEPTAGAPVQVSGADLARQARTVAGARSLSAHLFSDAWWCANRVVEGRITGLVPAVVDGARALLVYSTDGGVRRVTVVSGCPGPAARAGATVELDR